MNTIRVFGRTFTRASENEVYQTDLGYEPYIIVQDLPAGEWQVNVVLKGFRCEAKGASIEEAEQNLKQALTQLVLAELE